MSQDNPIPRKATLFDVKAILAYAVTGLLGCFFMMYTSQIKMGEALQVASEVQRETMSVVKRHESELNEGDTWKRVIDIRLTVIERKLGIQRIDEQ